MRPPLKKKGGKALEVQGSDSSFKSTGELVYLPENMCTGRKLMTDLGEEKGKGRKSD